MRSEVMTEYGRAEIGPLECLRHLVCAGCVCKRDGDEGAGFQRSQKGSIEGELMRGRGRETGTVKRLRCGRRS